MTHYFCSRALVVTLVSALSVVGIASAVIGSSLQRISVNVVGTPGNGASSRSSISPNGKFVAFESIADNLVLNDNNGVADIFIKNLNNGAISRVNLGRDGEEANGASSNPVITRRTVRGFYAVVYATDATNLARNRSKPDINTFQDIYASFPTIDATVRVSRNVNSGNANGRSEAPSATIVPEPNRILIAYASRATNLTENDSNSHYDIYLATMNGPRAGEEDSAEDGLTTTRITTSAVAGQETDGDSRVAQISGDGKFVVFESEATNLVPGRVTSGKQIFLHDIEEGTTSLITEGTDGLPANANCENPRVSYTGNFVTYFTLATNLTDDGLVTDPGVVQLFRYNRITGKHERVNTSSSGTPGNGETIANLNSVIDASGRFVLFTDRATNLVENDSGVAADVFVKDIATGEIERINLGPNGEEADAPSFFPEVNRTNFTDLFGIATFASAATNLVASDIEGVPDLFLSNLTFPPVPLSKNTVLEVPPDIELSDGIATIQLEEFDGANLRTTSRANLQTQQATRRPRPVVRYIVKVSKERENGNLREISRLTKKRNEVTIKNLKAGTYEVSYRATVQRGERTVLRTRFSPPQRFLVD